jgi:class 3 adenylate cyclase
MYVVLEALAQDAFDLPSDEGDGSSRRDRARAARLQALVVGLLVTVVGLAIGCYVSRMVTIPVRTVTELMQLLGELNNEESEQLANMYSCNTSRLREVRDLQHAFTSMSRSIEMFKRYVPNSVVRDIVRGDERAMRLHVSQREVTIMFSDIANFTSIAESLKQVDLLFLLTRYFSIMTRIVETYEGLVAEILGDGLVVFWNTPDDVLDHAAKACAAALAQQQVLKTLNAELSQFQLPEIKIRIGLHTGVVLSGNIGSESKMKFGCMGDPVNLASRLESLCKVYGVWILCSEATVRSVTRYDGLRNTDGFVMRELDLVQVKGKSQPTRIYEVMGISDEEVFNEEHLVNPERACGDSMQASTIGMKKLEDLRWNPLKNMARRFSMKFSDPTDSRQPSISPTVSPRPRDRDAIELLSSASQHSLRSSLSTRKPTLSPRPGRHMSPIDSASTSDARNYRFGEADEGSHGEAVPEHVRDKASRYEDALCAYQQGLFREARDKASRLKSDWPDDVATGMLLEQVSKYLGPDGKVCGLTEEERLAWTGVTVLSSK